MRARDCLTIFCIRADLPAVNALKLIRLVGNDREPQPFETSSHGRIAQRIDKGLVQFLDDVLGRRRRRDEPVPDASFKVRGEPACGDAGTCGNCGLGVLAVTTMPFRLPLRTCSTTFEKLSQIIDTRSPRTSWMAGAGPLVGNVYDIDTFKHLQRFAADVTGAAVACRCE